MDFNQSERILNQSEYGEIAIDAQLPDETVWLSLAQLGCLVPKQQNRIEKL